MSEDLHARVERIEHTLAAHQDAALRHRRSIEQLRRSGATTAGSLTKVRRQLERLENDLDHTRGTIDVAAEDVGQLRAETRAARELATAIAAELAAMPCDVRVTVVITLTDGSRIPVRSAADVEKARQRQIELARQNPGSRGHSSGNDDR